MNIRRVQSLPDLESGALSPPLSIQFDQYFVPKLEHLHQLHGSHISADHLFKILDGSMAAQKMGMTLAMDAINLGSTVADWKFINSFLDSTVLLLDACSNIKLRLGSIRNCLDSISVGLHYLESELEPNRALLQQAATALESSCLRDKRHYSKMEKKLSRMRTYNAKLNGSERERSERERSTSPLLYKVLRGSLAMAVFAIGVLSSATSIKSFTNEPSNRMKMFQKKVEKTASMEELASADLASKTLLKLISAWQKGGSSSLRRMAVKAVAGELWRRKNVLEKTLPLLEDKIEEFYQQIVAIRISMFGLLSENHEEVLEMVSECGYESRLDIVNHEQYQRGVAWGKVKKVTAPSFPLGRIRPPRCIGGFIKTTSVKSHAL